MTDFPLNDNIQFKFTITDFGFISTLNNIYSNFQIVYSPKQLTICGMMKLHKNIKTKQKFSEVDACSSIVLYFWFFYLD